MLKMLRNDFITILDFTQAAAKGTDLITVQESANDMTKSKQSSAKKNKNPTYSAMVMEAVVNLNEREGSSLQAIRKYILQNYEGIRQHQTASFHNLTLKAVNKAVALNELEKFKHSFRLSQAEKDRRKEAERKAQQALQRSLFPEVHLINLSIHARLKKII
jgi:hypothetical protein